MGTTEAANWRAHASGLQLNLHVTLRLRQHILSTTYDRPLAVPKVAEALQNSSVERVALMILLFFFMIPRLSIPLYDLKSG